MKGVNCPNCHTFVNFPVTSAVCPKCGISLEKMAAEIDEQKRLSAQAVKKLRSEIKKLSTERRIPHTFRINAQLLDRLRDESFSRKSRKDAVSDMSDILSEALHDWFKKNLK